MRKIIFAKITLGALVVVIPATALSQVAPNSEPAKETNIDQVKQSVVFIETHWSNSTAVTIDNKDCNPSSGHMCTSGTGFLIFVRVPELGKDENGNGLGLDFLVTAKHMIRERKDDGQSGPYAKYSIVRYNALKPVDESNKSWSSFDSRILDSRGDLTWFTDKSDPIADVALTPVTLGENAEYKTIPEDIFVTKDVITNLRVNENDEVLFAGLFTNYIEVSTLA